MALKETPVDYDPFAVTSPPMAAKGYREIPVDYDPFAAKPATVAKPAVLPPPSMDTAVPVGLEAGNLTNYDIENALALDAAATAAGRENAANMGIISGADAIAGTRPPKPLPVLPPSRATRERERQLFDSQYSRDQVEKIIGSEFIGKEKVVLAAYEERLKQLQSGFKTAAAAGDRDAATRFQEEAQAIIPEYQAAIGRFNATVQSLREGAPLYTSEFSDPWPTVLAKTGKAFFPRVGQGLAALFGALEETSPNRELFEKHGAGSTGMAAAKTWGQIAEEASPVVVPGTPKAWVSGALESVALNAPMALAGMASGSLALPLVGMGLIAGGQKYAELREKRPDIAIPLALSVAAGSGTMEGLTELIPLKTLLRTDIGIGKKLVNEMFQEIPTEMANTIYADLQDKMTTRPNMTWGDFLQDEIDTIMTTAIATPIMVGSTHKAVKYLERKRKEAIEADQKRIETYAKDVMADEAKLKQFKENLGIKDEGQPPEGPSASGPSSARPQPPPPVMPPPAAPAPSEPPLAMPPPSVPPRPVLPDGWLANRAGYPYKTEKSATEAMAKKGLAETHEVVAYENGFALKPKEEPVKATEEKTEEEVPPPPEIVQNAPTSQAEGTKYPVSGVKLYHSSDVPILDINPELYGSKTDEGLLGKGFYLSTDKNIGQGKGITSEFETSIESPLVVEYPEWGSDKAKLVSDAIGIDRASGEQLTKELISRGYDSVVLDYAPVGYDHKEVAIFDKAKLKPTSIVGEAPPSRRPVLPPPTKVSGEAGKPSTKTFVENKIRQLGSIEAVNAFYSGDDAISQYARQEAPKILGIKEKEPTTATKKEKKLPYGRSGVSVFKKIAATANLSEENSPDYDDFVSFFEQYYNAGVSGKDMPAIDMHPQDAHAAYQAGRDDAKKDQERSSAKKPVLPPPKKKAEAKPAMPVGNNVKKVIDKTAKEGTLESKGDEEDAVRGSSESAQRPVVDGSSRLDVEESPGKNEGSVLDGEVKGVSRPEGSQGAIKVGQPGGEGATEGTGNRSDREEPDHAAGRAGNERQPAGTATGATPEENSGMGGERLPRRESKGQNHRIGPDDTIYHSGKVSRINANIRAIQTLKKLEKENRPATNDEKKILAQFTGWGAVAQDVFNLKFDDYVRNNKGKKGRFWDDTPGSWKQIDREYKPSDIFSGKELEKYEEWESKYGSKLHPALNGLLSEEEWKAAQDSALNAHYTDRGVIEAMWSIAERLGFKGGKVLEPGAGVGHFFGLMPENLLKDSKLSGVELDPITGRILGKLYPDADIQVTGFEDAKRINDNSFDLVISNFPFGNYPVTDKKHPAYSGWSVHNYFFARSLDAVKPGGLVISVTSHYSMDTTKDGKIREYLAGKADLVGAIRLPGTAFEKNAGTSVTTDILIFRKKTGADYPNPQNWRLVLPVKSIEGDAVKVNEYFINNPKMVMGQHSSKGSMHAGKKEYTLLPSSEGTLKEQIEKAADLLPRNIMETSKPSLAETQAEEIRATDAHKEGTFAVHKGKVYMVHNGALSQVEFAGDAKKMTQALAYVGVRDSRTALIDLMRSELATDDEIAAAQAELSKLYDAYVKKYGNFHKRAKDAFLEEDEDFPTVLSLETVDRYYVAGVKTPFTKILKDDIFTTRTVFPFVEPKTAENVEDAVRLSVTYRNGVDLEYVSSLLNITKDDAKAKLLESELAYEDPATGIIESKEAYLSGNVREKLKIAELRGFDKNVEALKKVLPAFKYIDEVHYKIGSEWMPPDIIDAFIRDVMGVETETIRSAVELSDDASTCWRIGTSWSLDRSSSVYTQWGAEGLSGIDLVEDALNLRRPEIFDYYEDENGNEKRTKNNEKTLVAQQKQKEIVGYWEGDRLVPGAFRDYVMQHPEHITRIEQVFNEKANNYVVRQYEVPSFEHFPNASHAIKLRPHQMRAVIRGLIDKGVIYAHAVGTGKTYMYASLAMELKRIKRARKPMVVVQGSTLKQFAAQAHKLYPTARILTLAKEEIAGPTKRQAMMAKVANGNWDMVIIAHSTFNRISMDAAREAAFIEEQLEEIEAAIRQEGGDIDKAKRDDPPTVKELRKLLKRKRERLKKLADRSQDNAVTFESLGVDALLIDEAHTYKRGDFFTKMGNIRGLDRGAAQKSFDFMMKCRYVQEKTRGKNVYLATGTPVSNTIAEVWTLLRYARPELLKEYGVSQFDGFASLFGDTRVAIEPTETGEYKVIERFNKYSNGVQLINMWLSGADVILQEDVPGWSDMVPKLKNGEFTKVSLPRPKSLDAFIEDIRRRKQEWEDLEGKEKMAQRHVPIVLYGEAKKGSIDLRLVHPQNIDDPGSKVNKAVELAFKKWQDTKEDKGAQLIFCDLYQSPDPDAKKWINNENHSLGKIHVNPHLRGIPRFNLYEDIKKKLVSKGIPEAEIAIINESKYSSDSAKERLFERVNDGAVRILLGSTEKLGVGVNVQERLAHVIHIDAPPRPMDFEQRNGRIIRPGNGFKEVEVTLLATVNSMDEVTYNRLQKKQKFTNQLLRGNIPGNNFEDPSDQVQMTLEQMIAVASGNPLVMKQYELENNIRELETLKHGYEQKKGRLRHDIYRTEEDISRLKEHLSKTERKVVELKKAFEKTGTFQIKIGNKEYDTEADGVEALTEHIEEVKGKVEKLYNNKLEEIKKELAARLEAAKDLKTGKGEKVSGVNLTKVQEVLRAISFQGGKDIWMNGIRLTIVVSPEGPSLAGRWNLATLADFENEANVAATYYYGDYFNNPWGAAYKTAKGILNSIQKKIAELYEYPAEIKNDIEKKRKNKADMEEEIKKDFPHTERLENLRKEYADVLSQLGTAGTTDVQADDEIEIPIEETPASEKFYVRFDGKYKEVTGEPIDNDFGLSLFACKPSKDNHWGVFERSTGIAVAYAEKKIMAIENAFAAIEKQGIKKVKKKIQEAIGEKGLTPWGEATKAAEKETAAEDLDALRAIAKESWEDYQDRGGKDEFPIWEAKVARAEAILSQYGEGNIDTAQNMLDEAKHRWKMDWEVENDEYYPEGQSYPQEILTAQHVITSIRQGQGKLFKGDKDASLTLYGGLFPDPIAAAKAFRAVADDIKAAIPRLEALGKAVFDAGKQTYEDWTRAMKRHLGELWAKFKGYLEDIWKNAKAMNQRQKFKKLFDKKDKERGSISFKKKTVLPQPGHKFESPETEALFQSAKGIKKETVIEKIKAVATEIGHKIARDYEHLANSRQNAPLIFILKRLEKQRDVVADRTAREIGKVLSGLDKSEYDIFARKVILDDLLADVERGKYDNEKELPFKFTAESLAAEKERLDALVDENPKIAAALAKRKAMWEVVKGEYIDALKPYKANVEDMFKENYYRHQVLDYVESNGIFGTGSKRLAFPVSRGYTKERTGYAGLYNTDYLEAEHNIMAQMLYDIEMAEALTGIKSEEDISAQVKAKAKEKNFENLVGGPKNLSEIRKLEGQLAELRESGSMDSEDKKIAKGIIERLNELDPTRPFKQKIAMSFAKLRKLGVIDDTDIDYGGDLPGGIFSKLSELINEEGPWQKPIATIFKAIRERENLMRQTLGAKYLEWQHGIDKRAIPPGYTAWQPREGNVFYPVLTVDEKTAAAIMAGELDKLAPGSGDLFKKAMAVGGKRTQWIVRDEVAETLNNLTRERAKGIISSVDLKVMVAWKKWQLISPRRMIKYNIRNLTGDAEATFLGNPAGFGYVPQAIRELYAVFVGKQPMSADMLAWFTRGGMSSTLQAQEMDALKQAWMFTKLHDKEAGFLKNAWQKYWKVARLSTDFRESILRYASFLSYKEQLKKNGGKRPDNYGASKPETIDALDNIDDKAFWLSNDLLGAYDRVSVFGQWIRERAIPFWSWQEVNMKRYVQLFRNAADNGELATAIGKKAGITSLYAARKVGGFLIKAAAFAAILAVYNNLFWPDEEEKLPWDVRMRAHIILGKDADGNIEYFSRMGTLDDFLSWFGLDYIPKSLNDLLSGKSIKDVASAQAVKSLQAAPNKAVQGAVPFSKLGFELITRRSTFPDIFRPGAIRDRYLHIARSFGLENEYIALAGKPSRGYGESLNSLFMYKVDPNEADYRKAFDLKRDFLKKMGKEVDGFWITPDGDALYNMRLAMRYDDREAFRKYFMEYVERKIREGKDDAQIEQGIKRSLKSMHPVSGMSRGMQEAFARSLTDEEMKIMHGAVRFYYDVLEMGDNDDEERR